MRCKVIFFLIATYVLVSCPIRVEAWVNSDKPDVVGHVSTIPLLSDEEAYKVIKAAAILPDEKYLEGRSGEIDNPLYACRYIHGISKYYETVAYLIDLANAYYNDNRIGIAEIQAEALRACIGANKSGGYTLIEAVDAFLADTKSLDIDGVDESNNRIKAYKIMGVAVHAIGDIYAHRTIVTPELFQEFDEQDFKAGAYEELKQLVEVAARTGSDSDLSAVEYRKVDYYLDVRPSERYEDNPDMATVRYESSVRVIESLVAEGGAYDFRTTRWMGREVLINSHILRQYDVYTYKNYEPAYHFETGDWFKSGRERISDFMTGYYFVMRIIICLLLALTTPIFFCRKEE